MTNAKIVSTNLSVSADNLPFCTLSFIYYENKEQKTITTEPILLLNPNMETLQNSGGCAIIISIIKTIGTVNWETLQGSCCRIEITDNKVVKIQNILDDTYLTLMSGKEAVEEDTGKTKVEVTPINGETTTEIVED